MTIQNIDNAYHGVITLVSVIIPTHNRVTLLQEALHSVLSQQGLGELFNIEVIVIDDASTDNTPEIMSQYSNVRYIRLEKNLGESGARNAGIAASRGKYIAFLDDDDLWLPHKLKVQVPALEAHPEVGVVYSQNMIKGEGINSSWPDARRAPSGNVFHSFLLEDFISINTLLVRREAFKKAGAFDESLKTMQYYDICLRLAFHVPFLFIPGDVAIQRYSRTGTWTTTVVQGIYETTHRLVVERALAMLPDSDDVLPVRRRVLSALFAEIANNLAAVGERGWIGFERMRVHVLTGLQSCPSMVTDPVVRAVLIKIAGRLAHASIAPIASVQDFCTDIQSVLRHSESINWLKRRVLIADMWNEAASKLRRRSEAYVRQACLATIYAALYNPVLLTRRRFSNLLIHAILGSRKKWELRLRIHSKP
jgi:glycosyltransferase involved in cell wall biosynthesis